MTLPILINVLAFVGLAAVVFVIWVLLSSGRPSFLRGPGRVSLTGRAIVITGAGGGLGRLIALELCRKSLDVTLLVLLDIDEDGLALTKQAIELRGGPRVVSYNCDVSNEKQVSLVLDQARQAAAPLRLSVLINNAGVVGGKGQTCTEMTSAQFKRSLDVNVVGSFNTVHVLMADMIAKNDGMLVTISSATSMFGGARLCDYAASKWALQGFHESLRLELRAANASKVHTLLVCPFATDTPMFPGIFANQPWLLRQLCPILKAEKLAKQIVDSMFYNETFLVTPDVLRYAALAIHMMPSQLMDSLLDMCGGTTGMLTYEHRPMRSESVGSD